LGKKRPPGGRERLGSRPRVLGGGRTHGTESDAGTAIIPRGGRISLKAARPATRPPPRGLSRKRTRLAKSAPGTRGRCCTGGDGFRHLRGRGRRKGVGGPLLRLFPVATALLTPPFHGSDVVFTGRMVIEGGCALFQPGIAEEPGPEHGTKAWMARRRRCEADSEKLLFQGRLGLQASPARETARLLEERERAFRPHRRGPRPSSGASTSTGGDRRQGSELENDLPRS